MGHAFREAFRSLSRRPGFTLLVVLPLGLGVGATATVFSAVHGVLLRPPPFRDPETVMQVWERRPRLSLPEDIAAMSTDHFREWREVATVFDGMAMYGDAPFTYTGLAESPGPPRPLTAERVSPALFGVLGVPPALGRAFLPEEETPGREQVVILSHAFWVREFGGDEEILGRSLLLDDAPHEIVGITPEGFGFPVPTTGIYTPYPVTPPLPPDQGVRLELVQVVARLKDGIRPEQAEAEATALLARLSEASEVERQLNEGASVHLLSFAERMTRRLRDPLYALFGVTLLVLLIACGNVGNLLLTRAAENERELAVRAALGAGRGILFRRLFAESCLLALGTGTVGILLSIPGAALVRSLAALGLPQLANAGVRPAVLGFAFAVAAVAAIGFGVLPAFRAASRNPASALQGSARGDSTALTGARRGIFASLQLALALPLLIGAGLLARSFLNLVDTAPGYRAENTLTFAVPLPDSRYPTVENRTAALETLGERFAAIPGVEHAAFVDVLPLGGERSVVGFQRIGEAPVTDPNRVPRALLRRVTPGYFRAMGIPLLRGRTYEAADRSGTGVVVNQALVDQYLEDDPIGLAIPPMGAILGVVGNVRPDGPEIPVEPMIYELVRDDPLGGEASFGNMRAVLRVRPGTEVLLAATARLREFDPELAPLNPEGLDDRLHESVAQPRLYARLMGGFAGIALLLAGWGVFGVVSHRSASRIPSHGVRMALGATPAAIRSLVLRDGLRIAAFGLVPGIAASLLLAFVVRTELSPFLFLVEPLDPAVHVLTPLGLLLAALAASLAPARAASRIPLTAALRHE